MSGMSSPPLEPTGRMDLPSDIAVDSAGNLFIADTGNYRIRRVEASPVATISTTTATTTTSSSLPPGPRAQARRETERDTGGGEDEPRGHEGARAIGERHAPGTCTRHGDRAARAAARHGGGRHPPNKTSCIREASVAGPRIRRTRRRGSRPGGSAHLEIVVAGLDDRPGALAALAAPPRGGLSALTRLGHAAPDLVLACRHARSAPGHRWGDGERGEHRDDEYGTHCTSLASSHRVMRSALRIKIAVEPRGGGAVRTPAGSAAESVKANCSGLVPAGPAQRDPSDTCVRRPAARRTTDRSTAAC